MPKLYNITAEGTATFLNNISFGTDYQYGYIALGDFVGKKSGDWRFTAGNSTQKIIFQDSLNNPLLTIDQAQSKLFFLGNDISSGGTPPDLTSVITLTGVAAGSTNLGTFTGVTIPDNQTINQSLQALETPLESAISVNTTQTTNISTNATNIATQTTRVDNLVTLSGVANNATNLGTFTGTTIPDNQTNKQALQALETALETNSATDATQSTNIGNLVTLSGVATNATNLGTFTGTVIPDNQNIKQAIQSLETNLDAVLTSDATQTTNIATQTTRVDNLVTLSGVANNATNLGTFTGTTIADNQTVKSALQSLETAVESAGVFQTVSNIVTTNTTLQATSSRYIRCSSASGNITLTLPTAASASGRKFTFLRTNTSANTIVVDANGSETIDGALTVTLRFINEKLTIWSDGTSWYKEEHTATGAFTPTLIGSSVAGTQTYTVQQGFFTRILNRMEISVYILLSAKDVAMAGSAIISNLPMSSSSSLTINPLSVGFAQNIAFDADTIQLVAYITDSSNQIQLRELKNNAAAGTIGSAEISNTSSISIQGSYLVD